MCGACDLINNTFTSEYIDSDNIWYKYANFTYVYTRGMVTVFHGRVIGNYFNGNINKYGQYFPGIDSYYTLSKWNL